MGLVCAPISPPGASPPEKAKKAGRAISEAEAATSIAPSCTAVKASKKKRPSGTAVAANIVAALASVPSAIIAMPSAAARRNCRADRARFTRAPCPSTVRRSEERRGGKEGVRTGRYRRSPDHETKKYETEQIV